jgi:putative aminopeptidase FrvX
MADLDLQLLRQLCETVAVSGHEDAMISLLSREFQDRGLEPVTDSLGNVVARAMPSRPSGPHILLHAHMDQLGFIVTQVLEDGFLRVERVGGVSRLCGVGTEVVVVTPNALLPAVMGIKAHHLSAPEEEYRIPPIAEWYVDVGARDRDDAAALGIDVGRVIGFAPRFRQLSGARVSSPSLDNRVGCYVLLETARALAHRSSGCPVTLVGSVLEEFNLRGLVPAVRSAAPDVALGIDVTPACDSPDLVGRGSVVLGGGPAIKIMDFHGRGTVDGVMASPGVVAALEKAAQQSGLPYQKEVILGVLTEGSRIPSLLQGVPVGGISIPVRYTHTPVETADTADVAAAVEMALAFAEHASAGLDLGRGH